MELQQQRQKENYDDGVRGRAYVAENYDDGVRGRAYAVNDVVFLHNPAVKRGRSKKFHKPWQGPFKVAEVLGGHPCTELQMVITRESRRWSNSTG